MPMMTLAYLFTHSPIHTHTHTQSTSKDAIFIMIKFKSENQASCKYKNMIAYVMIADSKKTVNAQQQTALGVVIRLNSID